MIADIEQQFFSTVGKLVVAGGGGAVVAFALFRFLGTSWIEHQLAKKLEAAKSEISILAARRLKLHDREYLVFPELWSRLNKVFVSVNQAIVSARLIPQFRAMTPSEVESWINRSDLSEIETSYFNSERDKEQAYDRILGVRDLNKASKDLGKFHTYLEDNRIFLSTEIKSKFCKIDKSIQASLFAKGIDSRGYRAGQNKDYLLEALDVLDTQVKPLMEEIESLVQARLFPEKPQRKYPGGKRMISASVWLIGSAALE